ncbi:MAG TPA: hydrogenase expression/formation protein HypE [Candidatus Aminicenantes bacterium]|nr:hydrogenase expression/formation protein HypE [Candidatus Aminicenantes bacterium]HRY66255.1 hydrogenase expression/formation protein HypE [Candidatus Aminicenantes bacterium]HRZ73169.1 hydrogenase expression/formation protein HypE [Candidatus Aminicenantes bacterium]
MSKISLELGSGGRLMRDFIAGKIVPSFADPLLRDLGDAALLPGGLAFTTDSYVVDPLFFPGGDIGRLAVNGTVNDLVVSGAEPRFLSLAFILEEGLESEVLDRVIRSIRTAAKAAGVRIVTGDTKVVRRGQGDKVFVNTAGVGRSIARPRPERIRRGDKIILTGTLGDHSLAVTLARGEYGLKSGVRSDCAPLLFLLPLWKRGALWMRDVTRGGLATVLSELAERLPYPLLIEEDKIPLSRPVRAAAELLGIDPLFMACEGKAVVVAPAARAGDFLRRIRAHPLGRRAAVIGEVQDRVGRPGELLLRTGVGGLRLLEPLTSELLPRIC